MLTEEQLNIALEQLPAARVTMDYMVSRVTSTGYHTDPNDDKATICTVQLDNGYKVRGESVCVNPENFNEEIGKKVALDNAMDKLWPLFGFLLAESQYRSK